MAFGFSKIKSAFSKDMNNTAERSVVGVDVGSSGIKVVQLRDKKGVPTLDTYGELQLGPYGNVEIGRTVSLSAGKLTEAFVDIVRESSVSSKDVALAISFSASFTTIISVPTVDTDKITAMIPVEARKYIPVPLNEVTLDWFPVSAKSERSATKVLLAAIHNEALSRYQGMIKAANFNQRVTEIEVFSLIRSTLSQEDDTVAIIDLGAGSTKLYIAHKGVIAKTHSLRMSGAGITAELSEALGIDFKQAEELKRGVGLAGGEHVEKAQKIIATHLERGFREIHTALVRYSEEEERDIGRVILSGNGALLTGVVAYAHDMLSYPVHLAEPFSKVAYPAFLEDTLKEAGPTFAVATGAALRALMQED